VFNWIILDTPPLLFAADANHLSTLASGTLLVVRLGQTTIDSVTRAVNSLCDNNVLGVSVNAARSKDLFNKYTYYAGGPAAADHGEFEYVHEGEVD
jgi:protein-tyrosine kinase